ncbi:DUF1033 family protein [Listeria rocourtiae]|uniref:DUF1033 family protein n=1 Tax=Listeria rocourtiae TaxID=647910 RepID=UPI0003E8AC09|nr:DUF1033 family protein [Listeria rocourtiae]EUJ51226.1 hypothetical protein PROCOU_03989 [Listeria rocourtiae FSL F6-920]
MAKFQVIVTKGEYEPWWFFEDWKKDIELSFAYTEKSDAMSQYQVLATELMENYPNSAVKKKMYYWRLGQKMRRSIARSATMTFKHFMG